jgi:hypothetical protein
MRLWRSGMGQGWMKGSEVVRRVGGRKSHPELHRVRRLLPINTKFSNEASAACP